MKLSEGKRRRLEKTANARGVIAAIAIDHRDNLQEALARARGVATKAIEPREMTEFKSAVVKVLGPHVSAVLLDAEYGLPAVASLAGKAGVLLCYEKSGYDNTRRGRRLQLLADWSVQRLVEAGADGIKILLHYTPFEAEEVNQEKYALIERIGAECQALDVPFFLEFLGYDESNSADPLAYTRRRPEVVTRSIEEFSQDRYGVDVLKIEFPVALAHVEGARSFKGSQLWSRTEALAAYRRAAEAARRPFVYLSQGVTNEEYAESLELAVEADVPWSGVLCGRAIWKDGVAIYARKGVAALEDWLADQGLANLKTVEHCLNKAVSWTHFLKAPDAPA